MAIKLVCVWVPAGLSTQASDCASLPGYYGPDGNAAAACLPIAGYYGPPGASPTQCPQARGARSRARTHPHTCTHEHTHKHTHLLFSFISDQGSRGARYLRRPAPRSPAHHLGPPPLSPFAAAADQLLSPPPRSALTPSPILSLAAAHQMHPALRAPPTRPLPSRQGDGCPRPARNPPPPHTHTNPNSLSQNTYCPAGAAGPSACPPNTASPAGASDPTACTVRGRMGIGDCWRGGGVQEGGGEGGRERRRHFPKGARRGAHGGRRQPAAPALPARPMRVSEGGGRL